MIHRRMLLASAAVPILSPLTAVADAPYPDRLIKLVIPFPPGGPTDTIGRVFAHEIGRALGQTVFVENKAGAGGLTATADAARTPADGYTLLLDPSIFVTWPSLFKGLRFDPIGDFDPVALLGVVPLVVVTSTSNDIRSIRDVVKAAKAKPGDLTHSSPGVGSFMHLTGELVNKAEGIDIRHVPYKGTAPAINDVVGGFVTLMYAPVSTALPLIKGNRLRPLAVTTTQRLSKLPDVPTFAEEGLPKDEISTWYGIWVPKGVPKPIVEKLNLVIRKALDIREVKEVLAAQETEARPLNPSQFADFVKAEHTRWTKVIKDAGIQNE